MNNEIVVKSAFMFVKLIKTEIKIYIWYGGEYMPGFGFARSGGMKEKRYIFIDAGYLRSVVNEISSRYFNGDDLYEYLRFNVIGAGNNKIFYYDCLPNKKKRETEEAYIERYQKAVDFHNRLRVVPGMHVYEGILRNNGGKNVQKGVDVKIAVDMFHHTINNNMQKATLLTGDTDFVPLVESLVQLGMDVTLKYHQKHVNDELLYRADNRSIINADVVYGWLESDKREKYVIPRLSIGILENIDRFSIIGNIKSANNYDPITKVVEGTKIHHVIDGFDHLLKFNVFHSGKPATYTFGKSDLQLLKLAIEDKGYVVEWA